MSNIRVPVMPEPFWHAVVSRTAPIIDKAIRRADVAQEYADKAEENYGHVVDIEVKQLFTAEQVAALNAEWLEKVGPLAEAVEAAFACGMIPTTSAKEGGAARHSQQVRVADNLRAALSAITKD
jgi:hypothetical protein